MGEYMDSFLKSASSMGSHPDKNIINMLTLMAGDIHNNRHPSVKPKDLVGAIESTILRANPEEKLPIIYLMDSIMFNIRPSTYPELFSNQLASVFMDSYRTGSDATQSRLRKLVGNWCQRRPEHGGLPPAVLGEIQRRLDGSFDVEKFIKNQEARFGTYASRFPQNRQSEQPTELKGRVNKPYTEPNTVLNTRFDRKSAFPPELVRLRAERLLKEMQASMAIDPLSGYRFEELEIDRPDLARRLIEEALQEMEQEKVIGAPAGFGFDPNQKSHGAPVAVAPLVNRGYSQDLQKQNWSSEWLSSSAGVEPIVRRLYGGGFTASPGSPFLDPRSGLSFPSQRILDAYCGMRATHLKELVSMTSILSSPTSPKILSRNWLLPAAEWEHGKSHTLVVETSGFHDDDEDQEAEDLEKSSPNESFVERFTVPVDEKQKKCALTGNEFKKDYDDDEGCWVYKDAIRPDPAGPIYLASEYLRESNRKRGFATAFDS